MPKTEHIGLTCHQVQDFIDDGFVKIENAFSTDLARQCRDELWADIGLSPDDPKTGSNRLFGWDLRLRARSLKPPTHRPCIKPTINSSANAAGLHQKDLAPFRSAFPHAESPGDDGWHVDVSFGDDNPDFMEWRANVKSSGRALLMLFLFSDVGPDDAPTRIRKGSHATIARELLPYGEAGATLRQLSANGYASTEDCEVELATGAAGTVYLCHPFLVHAAQPHRGKRPRFMAQPPLLPKGEFDPALPPSPVQIAIRQACGLTR